MQNISKERYEGQKIRNTATDTPGENKWKMAHTVICIT